MTRKDLVFVVCRAFGIFFITWALVDFTYLMEHVLEVSHHYKVQGVLLAPSYLSTYYLTVTVLNALRTLGLSAAAFAFWQCGPRVQAFFERDQPTDSPATE